MRDSKKPASLNELMGGQGTRGMTMENLHEVLGEKMPIMPKNRIGKMRLMSALQERFGNNFRNLPGVLDLISEFDKDAETENVIRINKESQNA